VVSGRKKASNGSIHQIHSGYIFCAIIIVDSNSQKIEAFYLFNYLDIHEFLKNDKFKFFDSWLLQSLCISSHFFPASASGHFPQVPSTIPSPLLGFLIVLSSASSPHFRRSPQASSNHGFLTDSSNPIIASSLILSNPIPPANLDWWV
jgi:hypothetical protein